MGGINFSKIEKKWQKEWDEKKVFTAKEKKGTKKYYVLEQFPYPSGSGLHIGHTFVYTIGDIYARFKRMQGFNVLHPIGFDSFGLPAENAAIAAKSHPKKFTEAAIVNFRRQMKSFGFSYDWDREVQCHKPEYYKWDQWIFLKMLEKGLAYRKKAPVNWCPKCNTVLANEQVVGGKCWRHEDTDVEVKHLEQWFLKITEYADELFEDLKKLDGWPDLIKKMQENWIAKSEGSEIDFDINGKIWKVFTTRPDTLFGASFLVVSVQHPELMSLVTKENVKKINDFLKKMHSVKAEDAERMDKEGFFTGSYAVNPINGEKIPVWTGNFVVAEYGSGMVMGVPAHDQRDFDFAKKYKLPLKVVVRPEKSGKVSELERAFTDYGVLVNSGNFDGLYSDEAKEHIVKALELKKKGRKTTSFRLKDWLISRQRFWGTPIPIVYCEKCGAVPVAWENLPVKLPDDVKFDSVKNPLVGNKKFTNVSCPKCGLEGRRETDTMDTFANSSWYFLRYCDAGNQKEIFAKSKADYWMPIDVYIGGKEHAILHLIYSRFYVKFLRDLGLVNVDEPALRLFNQGFVYGSDGRKMSKSYGNVVVPEEASGKYGVDTVRLFLVSVASPEKDFSWSEEGVEGSLRFITKLFNFTDSFKERKMSALQESKLNRIIRDYTFDLENFKYSLGVIKLREMFYSLEEGCDKNSFFAFLKLLSPICPHISEELWSRLDGKGLVLSSAWPTYNEKKINDALEMAEKNREKVVEDVRNIVKIVKDKSGKDPAKVYLYVLPKEINDYDEKALAMKIGLAVKVYSVSDKGKHDPEGKSSKVKPGRPGIFVV